ncbi:hypothetical protein [Lentibacillus amyloliquefaciens]|uniref:Uncharacterized protein n=1 Tax=Lentibacillus amyloliquefaciens TaxID=1472767 RepID=A0A0U4G8K4_9BACI|nr:hypothetical protein [Lentibacillus amyloliquefaciens]ALX49066.1 hypothetical protein AOX59_10935 [Lentibacillus amyloliquefaciens]
MKKHIFWILPSIVIILGISLMLNESIADVTERPDENWSRGYKIGETTLDKKLPVRETAEGNYVLQTYEPDLLRVKTFNQAFELLNETSYDIPLDKWTQVFLNGDDLIYYDYSDIRDKEGNVIVADADRFYPLVNTALYIKENILYELNPANHESLEIMELGDNRDEIIPFQGKNHIYFMTETSRNNDVELNVYELADQKAEMIHEESFQIDPMQTVEDINFAVHDGNLAYIMETVQKQSQGSPQSYTYVTETSLGSSGAPSLEPLSFADPAGEGALTEANNITISYQNDAPHLLFSAGGYTETKYQNNQAFNIYSAAITDNGRIETFRKSNSPKSGTYPQWVNDSTIMWLEQSSDSKNIYVSSSNPAIIDKASSLNQDDWLRASGKTFGMLAKVLITILVTTIWLMWPVLFIVLMYAIKGRKLDEEQSWFFYAGIAVYLLAVLLFRDMVFIDDIFERAPDYLTFPGSSYVFILVSAVIAYIAAQSAKATRDWHAPSRIVYFAGAHALMVAIFFGPYFL